MPHPSSDSHTSADFTAVTWNLHKGRSPLGLQAWSAMRRWVQDKAADVFFLQEAMARRVPGTHRAAAFGQPLSGMPEDTWHCQATDLADAQQMQVALGTNVIKRTWRHGNAILSPHPLDLGGRWDISAHRFERRGLLVARAAFHDRQLTLLCAHLALTRSARIRQMEWIAHWIAREAPAGPLILAGDFNDWKNDSLPLFQSIGLREVSTSLGAPVKTFPAFSPALALDKMYVRQIAPLSVERPDPRAAWLSDHLPYVARLRFE
jgi:endonuclease/exonuclease/phosphatase family metal-dependent hydrolase